MEQFDKFPVPTQFVFSFSLLFYLLFVFLTIFLLAFSFSHGIRETFLNVLLDTTIQVLKPRKDFSNQMAAPMLDVSPPLPSLYFHSLPKTLMALAWKKKKKKDGACDLDPHKDANHRTLEDPPRRHLVALQLTRARQPVQAKDRATHDAHQARNVPRARAQGQASQA